MYTRIKTNEKGEKKKIGKKKRNTFQETNCDGKFEEKNEKRDVKQM